MPTLSVDMITEKDEADFNLKDEEVVVDLEGVPKNKRLIAISYYLFDHKRSNILMLTIAQDESYRSRYKIESKDEVWFNNTRAKLDEIIKDTKSQNNYFLANYNSLKVILAFYFGSMYIWLNNSITSNFVKPDPDVKPFSMTVKILAWMLLLTLGFIFGWIISSPLFRKIKRLWPNIEFDFGPPHTKYVALKRRTTFTVISVIIAPIILQVLNEILVPIFRRN